MEHTKIYPIGLRRMARAIAGNYGDKGAIVITMGNEGIRIGVEPPLLKRKPLSSCVRSIFACHTYSKGAKRNSS